MNIATPFDIAGDRSEKVHVARRSLEALGVNVAFDILEDGETITQTCDAGKITQNAKITLGGNRTLAIANPIPGMVGVLIVNQDETGGRTLTLPVGSKVQNGGAGAVSLTSAGESTDLLSWTYDGEFFYWTFGPNFN